jgi:hypothetical protein
VANTTNSRHTVEFYPKRIELLYQMSLQFSIRGIDKFIETYLEIAFETLQIGPLVAIVVEFHMFE